MGSWRAVRRRQSEMVHYSIDGGRNETYRAHLHLPPERLGDRHTAVRRDALDHVVAIRQHQRDRAVGGLHDAQEAGGRELVDLRARLAVQVQRDGEAFAARLGRPAHDGRVVAAQLGVAGPVRSGAVELFEDEGVDGRGAVVAGKGVDVHAEVVLGRWVQAQMTVGAENHGADVQSAAGAVGRDEGCVEGDG